MKSLMLALSVLLLSTPAYSAMESFTVDPRHPYPGFEVNHMGLEELEKRLRSEDFFNVEKHPLITFRSSSVEFEGDSPKSVQGDLTLLGVTRPVPLSISAFNCRIHPINKKYVCGADASTTIKRSEFGMTYAVPAVSDEVRLFIQVEAFKDGQ